MKLALIDTYPKPDKAPTEPEVVMLFCPDEGGWHTGSWWKGNWRLHGDLEHILTPTHWARIDVNQPARPGATLIEPIDDDDGPPHHLDEGQLGPANP